MKVASVKGYWSTNIGNSLFQISAEGIFNEIGAEVITVPDAPGFMNVKKGNPENYFEFMDLLDVDYYCIHGPFFRKEFDKIYLENIKKLKRRGVKIIGLGVGAMHYDKESVKYYNQWLKECDFDLIATRDELTYNFLKGKVKNLYNGIDLGFLIKFYKPQPNFINNEKLICFNFDQIPEPIFFEDKNGPILIDTKNYNYKKSLSNEPRGNLKKIFPFIRPYFKKFEDVSLNGYKIIRTDHRFNPYSRKKIYSDKNTFAMDTPEGYLLAYANSKLTLSNRVHANVASLSYGNTAMYFSDSKRANLLNRLGLEAIYEKPVNLNSSKLDFEKEELLKFIKTNL
jgi:hypothetical protein